MKAILHRRDVVNALLADRGELLVVAGLGSTAWDITAAGDHDLSFPLWGAMGSAVMIGLGLTMIVVTLTEGFGIGIVLGLLFVAAGAGRLVILRRRLGS